MKKTKRQTGALKKVPSLKESAKSFRNDPLFCCCCCVFCYRTPGFEKALELLFQKHKKHTTTPLPTGQQRKEENAHFQFTI